MIGPQNSIEGLAPHIYMQGQIVLLLSSDTFWKSKMNVSITVIKIKIFNS